MHNKKNNTNKSRNFIQGLRPLSNALPHGLKKIIKKSGYNLSNVVDNWSKIVGKNISNSCYPNSIKIGKELSNGILIINVIHGKELDIEYSNLAKQKGCKKFIRIPALGTKTEFIKALSNLITKSNNLDENNHIFYPKEKCPNNFRKCLCYDSL